MVKHLVALLALIVASPAHADERDALRAFKPVIDARQGKPAADFGQRALIAPRGDDQFEGRDILLTVPRHLPPAGQRAMVVVLHGGMGNAGTIRKALGLDAVSEQAGFVVAYLNGSPAAAQLNAKFKAWNAGGGCCGLPYRDNVNDVGTIERTIAYLSEKHGINPARIYGVGHSNGAMMVQRMACETRLFPLSVAIAGPLNTKTASCPGAAGKDIWAIHGSLDRNVPVGGGRGSKGITDVAYVSEAESKRIYELAGATYRLDMVAGADHRLGSVAQTIEKRDGRTLADSIAVFFGLAR